MITLGIILAETSFLLVDSEKDETGTRKSWNCRPFMKPQRLTYLKFSSSIQSFPDGSVSKESACNVRDPSLIPEWGRSPGEGDGNPLQYSYLGNPMDRGAWKATVQGVAKSGTRLSTHIHTSSLKERFSPPRKKSDLPSSPPKLESPPRMHTGTQNQ